MEIFNKDRIAFVNIKNGSIIFDCHPAEARMAMNVIKNIRRNDGRISFYDNFKENRILQNEAIQKQEPFKTLFCANPCLTISNLSKSFSVMEKENKIVQCLFVNAKRFADIRSFGKDVYDAASAEEVIHMGIFGYLWNSFVIVNNEIPDSEFYLTSSADFVNNEKDEIMIIKCCLAKEN